MNGYQRERAFHLLHVLERFQDGVDVSRHALGVIEGELRELFPDDAACRAEADALLAFLRAGGAPPLAPPLAGQLAARLAQLRTALL